MKKKKKIKLKKIYRTIFLIALALAVASLMDQNWFSFVLGFIVGFFAKLGYK